MPVGVHNVQSWALDSISCIIHCCRLATAVRIYYLCGVTCMILVLLDVCFIYFIPSGKCSFTSNT